MAYLGNQPSNNFVSLKRQVITGNGGSTYTLDHSVASVNDVAIFVNNVRQDPATYSISGTALTLGGTISSSDSCYVIFLGQALQTVVPDANTITNAMIQDGTIAESKLASGVNTITMADQWRLTADISSNTDPISSNLERVDDTGFNYIGTGMSVSSGTWSFPTTGIYLVRYNGVMSASGSNDTVFLKTKTTTDNSTYTDVLVTGASAPSGNLQNTITGEIFFDVTDTSTHKLQFEVLSIASGSLLRGDTSRNETFFTFIRLGDT